jgi:hypothetical protein
MKKLRSILFSDAGRKPWLRQPVSGIPV